MRTIILSLLIFLLFSLSSLLRAQDFPRNIGEIQLAEFDYQYKNDLDAAAIVLFDIGHSKFLTANDGSFDIEFKRRKRIKINKKAGLEYADIAIPYYVQDGRRAERIRDIKAFTYNRINGSLQKEAIDKKLIYKEKINEHWYQYKFAFPHAQEGSIIEYSYTLTTPFLYQMPDWTFQARIPTLYSSYTAQLIPFYEYVYLMQGIKAFHEKSAAQERGLKRYFAGLEFNDMIYHFSLKEIPAFEDESYITSVDDHIIKMDFQLAKIHHPDGTKQELITTYPKLIKELNEHLNFGKYLKKAKKLSKNILAKELILTEKSPIEKSKAIIEYVKAHFDWDEKYRKFTQNTPKEIFQRKRGSTAEINLLLTALLNTAGIEAYPVLISTRDHGRIYKQYPFEHQFNSVVVYVTGVDKKFMTDGTNDLLPYNRIPIECINDQGLIINENTLNWVAISAQLRSSVNRKIEITPDLDNNKVKTKVNLALSEVEAYLYRNGYKDDAVAIEKALSERNFENIQNIKTENYDNLKKFYKIDFEADMAIESFDDNYLISPFLNYPPQENLLKQKERTYPVDLIYKKTANYGAFIHIPDGYTITEMPENLAFTDELMQFIYKLEKQEKAIKITATVNYRKAIYPPADYVQLKKHLDLITEKLNEQILLQKKT